MPLTRLELRNEFGLGDPKLYRGAAVGKECTKEILDGLAVAGLVGILRQLGDVAEFSAEIFHDLHEQIMATSSRGHTILSRIRRIEESLPSIEDAICKKGSYIHLAYETGSDWHSDIKVMDNHLSYNNFPRFLMDSYEECRDPPRLYLLDKYDRAGTGACFKRYSDPSYFNREWATTEPDKAQRIQKEKKPQKIKRKYSRVRDSEIQPQIFTSQYKSLASIARFTPPGNDNQCFSAENSSVSELRLKHEVFGGPRLLKTTNKLNCTGGISVECPSVMPNDLEYDRLSVSNVVNNQDHQDATQQYSNGLVFSVNCDSHWNSVSRPPSVIWDEKSEFMKAMSLKFSNDASQDLKLLFASSESSKVEPARNGSMELAKPLPIIKDLPRSRSVEQFEEVIEVDSFMDALNTLELEAEADFECQEKCIQSLSSKGYQKDESKVTKIPKKHTYCSTEVPPALHASSTNYMLPSDTYFDVSRTVELKQSTQGAVVSPGLRSDEIQLSANAFQEIDDECSWSNDAKSENTEAIFQIHISPPISTSSISSTKFWTNGNLLGLQPSKPPDICIADGLGERTESNILNTGMKSMKENIANGQKPQQLKTINKVEGLPESLCLADQRSLNRNQFLSRKYVNEGKNSKKHSSTYIDCQCDGIYAKQKSQGLSETISFNQHDASQIVSHNLLTTCIDQEHKTTSFAFNMEMEPYSASDVVSRSIDSLDNSKCLFPSFSELSQRNLVQGLQVNPSITHTKSSIRNVSNVNDSRSEGKPVVDIHPKSSNRVSSQTFSEQILASQISKNQNLSSQTSQEQNLESETSPEQNLASQTSHKRNLINNTNNEFLEKSNSSSFYYSRTSSPPLEHMKILFHSMNSQAASHLKLEVLDGCTSEIIGGNVLPSFRLFPGCTLSAQDEGFESDDDTFCRSPYSTEDLLSRCSNSNSDPWEQVDCSVSKIDELPDDLRRISSFSASISSYGEFGQRDHLNQEIGLKDICSENDTLPFQPGYIANIPSLESLINHIEYDSLSISPKNSSALAPTELPPPPPLPPIQWRLPRRSYEISEDNYSNITRLVNHFEGHLNQSVPSSAKNKNVIRWPPTLWKDEQYKKMQDNQMMDSLLQTNISADHHELHEQHGREQLLHQIMNMDIQHKFKPCEKSKGQVATRDGIDEREYLLHQLKTKAFSLKRTTTRPSVTQSSANHKVAAILEKARAIRQACANSDDGDDSDEWSDG